jgi:hypothetical protein
MELLKNSESLHRFERRNRNSWQLVELVGVLPTPNRIPGRDDLICTLYSASERSALKGSYVVPYVL